METYREKLKLQNVVFAIGCVVLALFSVLGFLGEAGVVKLAPSVGDGHWQSRWRGFISGASFGILVLLLTNKTVTSSVRLTVMLKYPATIPAASPRIRVARMASHSALATICA